MLDFRGKIQKIENFEKNEETKKIFWGLLELSEREPGWRFTARCHTETVAKPARPGPAKNDGTPP